ncbi:MAG: SMP-30/gluconolactonase/LRE family protein [Acidobacteriota bacterium]|nr:SMP-30/gluconolactonase/LRE family protein [Acidobacteriota bacterium]
MQEFTATPCGTETHLLGEGVRFDEVRGELSWVSVYDGAFLRARADGPDVEVIARHDLGGQVGAVAPYEDRADGWIVARDQSLYHLGESGALDALASPEAGRPDVRLNDGAADPWGRYWVGSMALDYGPGRGSLFRFHESSGVETVLAGVTISNGLGWSADRRTLYYVDSGPATIYAFDVDRHGDVANQRAWVQLDASRDGSPDGLCLDAEGAVWVAMWGGRCVRRYAPSGELLAVVHVATAQPSCCAIGGEGATTLYVTTAREDLTEEQLAEDPLAGRMFSVDVGVPGVPLDPYRPTLAAL